MSKRILYIIVGLLAVLLILIGISLFVFIPTLTAASNTQATPTAVATTPAVTPTRTVNPTTKALKQYAPDIKNQIAQGLKLTPEQLTAQLQSGKTLNDIATAQNVSTTQLQTILSNALQTSLKPAVDNGDITQKQLDNLVKRYEKNPNSLDKLLGGKTVKKQAVTPTPTN